MQLNTDRTPAAIPAVEPFDLDRVAAAARSFPGVRDAVADVVAWPDGTSRLVVWCEADDWLVWGIDVRLHLAEELPGQLVPARVVVVDSFRRDDAGVLPSGTLPPPHFGVRECTAVFVAPETPLELALAETWADLLELDAVGVDDDFFELGGHSLLAAAAAARLGKRLGREIPAGAMFAGTTVRAIVAALEEQPDD